MITKTYTINNSTVSKSTNTHVTGHVDTGHVDTGHVDTGHVVDTDDGDTDEARTQTRGSGKRERSHTGLVSRRQKGVTHAIGAVLLVQRQQDMYMYM